MVEMKMNLDLNLIGHQVKIDINLVIQYRSGRQRKGSRK